MTEIQPQSGPQWKFVVCDADIVFYGGSAGGGKSYALLIDAMHDADNKDYGAVIFRRTTKQVRAEGGLWDTARNLYSMIGGKSNESDLQITLPSGARIGFAHIGDEQKLAELLVTLYRNSGLRTSIAEEARRTITPMFSLSKLQDEIINFCHSLSNPTQTPGA